jgi:hypothetical protein
MQAGFEKQSNLKLTIMMENFIKEYFSLILLLLSIFTVIVGRFIANIQLCIIWCSCHRDQDNFGQNEFLGKTPAQCMQYSIRKL